MEWLFVRRSRREDGESFMAGLAVVRSPVFVAGDRRSAGTG